MRNNLAFQTTLKHFPVPLGAWLSKDEGIEPRAKDLHRDLYSGYTSYITIHPI